MYPRGSRTNPYLPPHGLPSVAVLALLDIGPTEFLLIAGLFVLLFGAEKVPELARAIGKASAQLRSTSAQLQDELDAERGLAFRPGDAVPPEQVRQLEESELERLRRAALELGIEPLGKTEAELRAAIAARVGQGR